MKNDNMPFFAIITSTYNAANTLERLLSSLASQSCKDFVWIMQDGASNDATMSIAQKWKEKLPQVSIESKKDTGIYDAWNRALERQGEGPGLWVLFLGADDKLASPDTLKIVKKKISNFPKDTYFASGDVQICDEDLILEVQQGLDEKALETMKCGGSVKHSGLFTHKTIFDKSAFNSSYAYCGDHDFVLRHWKSTSDGLPLNICVTQMHIGGVTSNFSSLLRFRYEFFKVMQQHFGLNKALPYFVHCIKALIPYALCKLIGEEKTQKFYHWQRVIRNLPKATIR